MGVPRTGWLRADDTIGVCLLLDEDRGAPWQARTAPTRRKVGYGGDASKTIDFDRGAAEQERLREVRMALRTVTRLVNTRKLSKARKLFPVDYGGERRANRALFSGATRRAGEVIFSLRTGPIPRSQRAGWMAGAEQGYYRVAAMAASARLSWPRRETGSSRELDRVCPPSWYV